MKPYQRSPFWTKSPKCLYVELPEGSIHSSIDATPSGSVAAVVIVVPWTSFPQLPVPSGFTPTVVGDAVGRVVNTGPTFGVAVGVGVGVGGAVGAAVGLAVATTAVVGLGVGLAVGVGVGVAVAVAAVVGVG